MCPIIPFVPKAKSPKCLNMYGKMMLAFVKKILRGMKELYKKRKRNNERLFGGYFLRILNLRYTREKKEKSKWRIKVGLTLACLSISKKLVKWIANIPFILPT